MGDMSEFTMITVLILAVFGQVHAEMPQVDHALFLPWSNFQDKILGRTYTVLQTIDYRAPQSSIPDMVRDRFQYQGSGGPMQTEMNHLRVHFASWNDKSNACFSKAFPLTKGSNSFAELINVVKGPFNTPLESHRVFISSHPDKYVLMIICFGVKQDGGCYDALVAIAVPEDVFAVDKEDIDVDGDGVMEEGHSLPLAEMNADARRAFNLPEGQDVVQGWPTDGETCRLPPF